MAVLDPLRELTFVSLALRLVLAMVLGGAMGLERGRKGRAAGLRTYMLVCMGSALTGILSQYLFLMCEGPWAAAVAAVGRRVDVSRLGAKVYSGIGFLGVGTILVTGRREVKGLTTAVGLWAAACMGIALGAGFYECAGIGFVLIVLCMNVLPGVENRIVENGRNMTLEVSVSSFEAIGAVIGAVKALPAQIVELEPDGETPGAAMTIRLGRRMPHSDVVAALAALACVTAIRET